ncbi:FAD-binding protein [Nonomuraea sp. PA05]|uniref:FAD-dependent monooxygenase n=1 Tax=Nonomuraea sp. PA05 TaxID=2604466 RepID=UPI0011DB6C1E|nr:FAD-dependent monooxygenase [Nonomuraea sp. PA05]TYB67070.1 FAD-binding protein [Nonomuraea sp. PA05]
MERVPVLVVGGGYAGLSAATLLAWREVPVMLVERHPSTSVQPKAFGIGPRALELLRPVQGIEDELRDIWAGIGDGMRIAIARDMADPEPHLITDGGQAEYAFLAALTPVAMVGAPQADIERVLRVKAEELGADLRFSTELVSLEQDADGVTALIRGKDGDRLVRADYVVAADGHHSPLRTALGVPTSGKGELGRMCSIMFDADLSDLVREREVTLWYLRNDDLTGVLVTGAGAGAHVLGVHDADGLVPVDRCAELVRLATGRPDLNVRILDRATFGIAHVLADTYRAGRVFLAGDAAHTMPPTGGQGGSTALQDGADLAWRLWLVLTGQAGPAFLDTYDAERRPIGTLTADAQLAELGTRMPPAARIGYPEPLPDLLHTLLGHRCHSTAILSEPGDDGSILEDPRHAGGRPGSRAPHVVLDWDGQRISTIDLFGSGFVLMAAKQGRQAWMEAGRVVKERLGVALTRLPVDDELLDVEGRFEERYGVSGGGAVLVRPDGYVAWRSPGAVQDPVATLERVLQQILGR